MRRNTAATSSKVKRLPVGYQQDAVQEAYHEHVAGMVYYNQRELGAAWRQMLKQADAGEILCPLTVAR